MISPEYVSVARYRIAKWKDSGLSLYQICRIKLGGRLSVESAQKLINSHEPPGPGKCSECGKFTKLRHNHHTNYVKDIVVPLCVRCHRRRHRGPRMDISGVLPHSESELLKWFPNWNGESQLRSQINLTADNETLLETFKELCRQVIPTYNETPTSIANAMLTEKLRQEIERLRKKAK